MHGLPSPVLSGPAQGCTKWFFYPGFTAETGGLLREPGLPAPQPAPSLQPPAQTLVDAAFFALASRLARRASPGVGLT
jgi:hypothetical protein